MGFNLHPQLAKDSFFIKDLEICQLRLMNDARFFWLILVPKIENAIELHDLVETDQNIIFNEIMLVSKKITHFDNFDKINIGALGNMVSQLHIHVIGRKKDDAAWPSPVWGKGEALPIKNISEIISQIQQII